MSAPQKKPDNTGWYVWPLIIVLFGLGLWPVALVLLFLTIFGDEKRKKQPTSQRKPSAEERVERAVVSLGRQQLRQLIDEDHGTEVCCHFCGKKYAFSEDQLRDILELASH